MKRRLLILFLFVLIFVIVAFFYIHTVFLPFQLKQIIVGKAGEFLDRKLTIGQIHYNLVKGALVKDLTLYRKDEEHLPFIHIEEARFSVLIPAIFKDQKIIIPSLTVKNPYIHLIRTDHKTWNFSDMLNKQGKSGAKRSFPFLLGSITVEHGRIELTNKSVNPTTKEIFDETNLTARLSLKKGITYKLETVIPEQSSLIKATGDYHLLSKRLTAQIAVEKLDLSSHLSLIPGDKDRALKGVFIESGEADLSLEKEKDRVIIKGNMVLNDSVLRFRRDIRLNGTMALKDAFFSRKDGVMSLNGRLEISQARLKIAENKHLTGNIIVEDAFFSRKAGIMSLIGQLEVSQAHLKLAENKHLTGNITVKDAVLALQDRKVDIQGRVEIQQAVFSSTDKKFEIPDMSGSLRYSDNAIVWKDLKSLFKNTTYTLNGQVTNLSRPIVETQISSTQLTLAAKIKILNQALSVPSLTGKYYNSPFNIKGDVHFKEEGGPVWDLKGHTDLDVADLSRIKPSWKEKLRKIKPSGTLPLNINFKGTVSGWKNASVAASLETADISLWGYTFSDVAGKLKQGDLELSELTLTGTLYDGNLSLDGTLDVKQDKMPFKLTVQLEDTNLAKLKKDSRWKDRDIDGNLSLTLNLAGPFKETAAIRGNGAIILREGHLWEFNLLKGLWGALLIPEFENIIFTEASANFVIEDRRATTHNISLKSRPIDVLGEGWIDFDKNIAFTVTPDIKMSEITKSDSAKKAPTAILAQVIGGTVIKVSGTLSDPKFEKIIHPGKVIERITDSIGTATDTIIDEIPEIFKEGVKDILEEIFQ